MTTAFAADCARELAHWRAAAQRLGDPEAVAPAVAWQGLEHYLGVSLRGSIRSVTGRLRAAVESLDRTLLSRGEIDPVQWQARLALVRQAYTRAETVVDFYSDALLTRASARMGALLRACDHLATRSMAEALVPIGREVPSAMTYLDRGLGASILKAGLRLWDGTEENVVAAIKVTRHNLLRPTSLIHEAGHQVAHMVNWVPELSARLAHVGTSPEVGRTWAGWASEIAADVFAHVHTGYGAAVALHDVLDGTHASVFNLIEGDPHPVAWLRVLLVLAMARHTFGPGPWDAMEEHWKVRHPVARAPRDVRALLQESQRVMPRLAAVALDTRLSGFGGRAVTQVIDPQRVAPSTLESLGRAAGQASGYALWNESIRLTAWHALQATRGAAALAAAAEAQERMMLTLGGRTLQRVA